MSNILRVDRYSAIVENVTATARLAATPDGGYVKVSDYSAVVAHAEMLAAALTDVLDLGLNETYDKARSVLRQYREET